MLIKVQSLFRLKKPTNKEFFLKKNWRIYTELFVGPLIPLLWTSGVMSSGSQSQSGKPYTHLTEERKKETLRKLNSNDTFSFYFYFVQGFPARWKHTCWGSSEEKGHYHGRGGGVSRCQRHQSSRH